MVAIPSAVLDLMNKPGTVKALISASKDGVPHAIVAGTIMSTAPDTMIFGEILSKVSVKNLAENDNAAFLVSNATESYVINCKVKAKLTSGPELDGLNEKVAKMHLHANALWVFTVASVFNQSATPAAGTKLA